MSTDEMRAQAKFLAQETQEARQMVDLQVLQNELDAAVEQAWREAYPRRKKVPSKDKLREWEGYPALLDLAKANLNRLRDEQTARLADLDKRLEALIAEGVRPQAGDQEAELYRAYSFTYNSQGYASAKYTRGMVEMQADVARMYQIPVDVVEYEPEWAQVKSYQIPPREVVAFVKVQDPEVDLFLLRACPPPSLAEQVRMCWKRGVNPRVYNPFLPHEFESQHGLDYQGGRV